MRELAAQVQPGIWDEYEYAVYEILYLASSKTSITGTSWEDERGKKQYDLLFVSFWQFNVGSRYYNIAHDDSFVTC